MTRLNQLWPLIAALTFGCAGNPGNPKTYDPAHDVREEHFDSTVSRGLAQSLSQYGMSEVRPPSDLISPGTIVWVRHTKPLEVDIVCDQSGAFGDSLHVQSSPTRGRVGSSEYGREQQLSGAALKALTGRRNYQGVQRINFIISKPRVETISAEEIFAQVSRRSAACQYAIDELYRNDKRINLVSNVLRADITYTIIFNDSLSRDLEAKADVLKQLSMELGAKEVSLASSSLSGDSLVWGVRFNSQLLSLRKDGTYLGGEMAEGDTTAAATDTTSSFGDPTALPHDTSAYVP